jgi:hypothetical protein
VKGTLSFTEPKILLAYLQQLNAKSCPEPVMSSLRPNSVPIGSRYDFVVQYLRIGINWASYLFLYALYAGKLQADNATKMKLDNCG